MGKPKTWYVVLASKLDRSSAASKISEELNIPMEEHESEYLGVYFLSAQKGRILDNLKVIVRRNFEPENDYYEESDHTDYQTVVQISGQIIPEQVVPKLVQFDFIEVRSKQLN